MFSNGHWVDDSYTGLIHTPQTPTLYLRVVWVQGGQTGIHGGFALYIARENFSQIFRIRKENSSGKMDFAEIMWKSNVFWMIMKILSGNLAASNSGSGKMSGKWNADSSLAGRLRFLPDRRKRELSERVASLPENIFWPEKWTIPLTTLAWESQASGRRRRPRR